MRAVSWPFLAVAVLAAVGGIVGGLVRVVAGIFDSDTGSIATGVVGILLGGAFAAVANGLRSGTNAEG